MINLDDDKETSITLKLEDGAIEISSEKKIKSKAGKDTMTLEDGKGLNIKSNNGTVTAKTNINTKGNSNVTIDPSQKIILKSKANVEESGMRVKKFRVKS